MNFWLLDDISEVYQGEATHFQSFRCLKSLLARKRDRRTVCSVALKPFSGTITRMSSLFRLWLTHRSLVLSGILTLSMSSNIVSLSLHSLHVVSVLSTFCVSLMLVLSFAFRRQVFFIWIAFLSAWISSSCFCRAVVFFVCFIYVFHQSAICTLVRAESKGALCFVDVFQQLNSYPLVLSVKWILQIFLLSFSASLRLLSFCCSCIFVFPLSPTSISATLMRILAYFESDVAKIKRINNLRSKNRFRAALYVLFYLCIPKSIFLEEYTNG